MQRLLQAALHVLVILAFNVGTQAAVVLTFDSYSWNQADVPTIGHQLGVNDTTTRSGASFGPANDTNLTRTGNIAGFIESKPGANTAVGYLSRITERKTSEAPAKLETTGTRALNLPQNANINAAIIRRGIQVGWTTADTGLARPVLANGTGTDFVIWESGDHDQPDAMMARVRKAGSLQFTDWFFFTPTQHNVTGSVLFAFDYDLSNFGLAAGAQIDLIEMANMVSTDRIDGPATSSTPNGFAAQGHVRPEAGGPFSLSNPGPDPGNVSPSYGVPFGNSTYDPDPLYVSVHHNLQTFVPEPASLITWSLIIGLGTFAYVRRGGMANR